jgi:quinohemoprotein ethanol dehydrogenase
MAGSQNLRACARLFACLASLGLASATSAADVAKNWPAVGRTHGEQNFSPLAQINERTVGRLGLAWSYDLNSERGVEAEPLEADGVLYDIQPWNITTALDARTGRVLWTYDPKVDTRIGRFACCDIDTRGLALWQGKIILGTLDGRLIALDAKTGQPIWSVQTFDRSQPYTITGAPRVFDGKVVIGNAGADLGVRGFVTAYDADTGRQLWRFYPVPGDPSRPYEDPALQRAATTWRGEYWKGGGGGNVWDSMVYDPKLKLLYLGTGNAAPWSPVGGEDRLYSASIVAVDAATGRYVWHYQETPNDQWDYDAAEPMILADLKIKGRTRQVILQAPKNGFFYVLDRKTGELLSAAAYVDVTWANGIDMKTGRPIRNPAAKVGEKPVMISPSPSGAHGFNQMSFSPVTGLAYFPVMQSYFPFSSSNKAEGERVGADPRYAAERKQIQEYAETHLRAWLAAWDPVRQKEIWRVAYQRNGSGGVLATAGNLVFQGTIEQTLAAYGAGDGRKVWEMPLQNVAIASPISYELDGQQYIAVNAGWGGGTARIESFRFKDLHNGPSRLLVFRLGGTARLPAMATAADEPIVAPPLSTASADEINRGAELFAKRCALCHGTQARGGVKDLRWLTPDLHAKFFDIVLGGTDKAKGMASFAEVLSQDEAAAIHAYLIRRANEDWPAAQAEAAGKAH